MRPIILYIASSLNGKIAKADGSVDWLETIPNPDKSDYGYDEFYASVETTIQGYNTFQQIRAWNMAFPYIGKKNYVLTTQPNPEPYEHVEFINNDHIEFVRNLKKQEGGPIWLIGGGRANALLMDEGLIDEIQVFVMPILLDDGIDIFHPLGKDHRITLKGTQQYPSGAVRMTYKPA